MSAATFAPGSRQRRALTAAAVVALAALAFAPALAAPFAGDDFLLLRTAHAVQDVWWPFAHNDLGQPVSAGHFYRPLWVLWNAGILGLFGARAAAFHALNLVLFAIVTLEVFALAARLAGRRAALIAALAFALYPRHAESVAWVSGNTDLLATAIGLGALLLALRARSLPTAVLAGAVGALALLTKEATVVLPVLAGLCAFYLPRRPEAQPWWRGPAALLAGAAVALALRTVAIHGLGGYSGDPLTLKRAAGSAVSFAVGALTPPQLEVLRHPVALALPLLAACLIVWRLYVLRRARDPRLRLALLGLAWAVVALAPVINLPLDLNTGNGDRLLLLPSVGLAVAFAALLPCALGARGRTALLAAGAAAAILCVADAREWVTAGRLATRTVDQVVALAPAHGTVVMLSVPEAYRSAHVLPDSLDVAVQDSGRPGTAVSACFAVHVRRARAGAVAFAPAAPGSFSGRATQDAPFDVPVLGSSLHSSAGCAISKRPGPGDAPPGTATRGLATPAVPAGPVVYAYFDGHDVRRCCRAP